VSRCGRPRKRPVPSSADDGNPPRSSRGQDQSRRRCANSN
jgi:hypothetical protein